MIKKLNIDIETRSGYDIGSTGVYEYINSPDFAILWFAYKVNDGETIRIDLTEQALPPEILAALQDNNVEKRAWSAQFERVALSTLFHKPPHNTFLSPIGWRCTMIEAMANGLPGGLGRCAAALQLETQKMKEGAALIRLFSLPQKPTKKRPQGGYVSPNEEPEKWATFGEYCGADVDTEHGIEMWLKENNLNEHMLYNNGRLWQEYIMDQLINDEGVPVHTDTLNIAHFLDDTRRAELEIELKKRGIEKPTSPASIVKWLKAQGSPVTFFNKQSREDLLRETDLPPFIVDTIQKAAELLSKSAQKPLSMHEYSKTTGVMRGTLQFIGANRTGRWSGRGPQLQNLKRNDDNTEEKMQLMISNPYEFYTTEKNVRETVGEMSRFFIQAPQGKSFVVVDFSAIEARVLAWLAGEEWVLDVFRNGRDIYVETASRMFNIPADQVKERGYRQKGKVAVLALGYQGGEGALAAMDFKKEIPQEEYAGLRDVYRRANANIVQFWAKVQDAIQTVTKAVHSYEGMDIGWYIVPIAINNSNFQHIEISAKKLTNGKATMRIKLPSGRYLVYQDIAMATNKFGSPCIQYLASGDGAEGGSYGKAHLKTYGGKVVENITQAVARDILAHTLYEAMRAGYTALFSVHDEGVWLIDDDKAKTAYKEIQDIMATPPYWAEGLPLDSDGFIAKNYKK